MSSVYFATPCSRLNREQLKKRLTDYLDRKPEIEIKAGVCQVCGHDLPVAYRAVSVVDGACKVFEAAPGSEGATRFESKLKAGELGEYEKTGMLFFRQCACEAYGPEWDPNGPTIWEEARKRLEEIRSERRRRATSAGPSDIADKMRPNREPRQLTHGHNEI